MLKTGVTIKMLRLANSMKQGELAEKVGIASSYLSAVETGKRIPDIPTLKKLAESLHVPIALLLIDDDPYPEAKELKRLLAETIAERMWSNGQNHHGS